MRYVQADEGLVAAHCSGLGRSERPLRFLHRVAGSVYTQVPIVVSALAVRTDDAVLFDDMTTPEIEFKLSMSARALLAGLEVLIPRLGADAEASFFKAHATYGSACRR